MIPLWDAIRGNTRYEYKDIFKATDITSEAMKAAILEWFDAYYRDMCNCDTDTVQRLPYTIVRKLSKTVFSEYEYTVNENDERLLSIMDELDAVRNEAIQQAMIGGQCLIKPVLYKDGFKFSVIERRNYSVFARNEFKEITSIGTVEITQDGSKYYTLFEKRTTDGEKLTIENTLYCSDRATEVGREVPLTALPKYELLQPVVEMQVSSIGLIPLSMPVANCVDGSPDPVSIFAAAMGVVRKIDKTEAQEGYEFESARRRLVVDASMLSRQRDHKGVVREALTDDVFTGLEGDTGGQSVGITDFTPTIRHEAFEKRINRLHRVAENNVGLKRGILSDVEADEKTATAVTSSEGDYNLTIIDLENAWVATVSNIITVCGELGALYHNWKGELTHEDVTMSFGDGVLYNPDKTYARRVQLMSLGHLDPAFVVGWEMDGKTPQTDEEIEAVREKYIPQRDVVEITEEPTQRGVL